MNESKRTEQRMKTSKETYVKPAIEVIEMEIEECILVGTTSGLPGSEANAGNINNPFGSTIDNLKA